MHMKYLLHLCKTFIKFLTQKKIKGYYRQRYHDYISMIIYFCCINFIIKRFSLRVANSNILASLAFQLSVYYVNVPSICYLDRKYHYKISMNSLNLITPPLPRIFCCFWLGPCLYQKFQISIIPKRLTAEKHNFLLFLSAQAVRVVVVVVRTRIFLATSRMALFAKLKIAFQVASRRPMTKKIKRKMEKKNQKQQK